MSSRPVRRGRPASVILPFAVGEVGAELAQGDFAVIARRDRLRSPWSRPRRRVRRTARTSSPARWARAACNRWDAAGRRGFRAEGICPRARESRAPISASGRMMRCIGRRESDSSPKMRVGKGWAARMPLSMRMVEPELPASRSAAGARSPSRPLAADPHIRAVNFHVDAERAHAAQRGVAIGARGIVLDARFAVRDGGDHGVAVGDGFVAGQGDGAGNRRSGNNTLLHGNLEGLQIF